MILEETLLAKRLIRKLEKTNNDLVDLQEIIGLFNFPEDLKNTVSNLRKEDSDLIRKVIITSVEYLKNFIKTNEDKIIMYVEDLLNRFKQTEILIQELINTKVTNTDNEHIKYIYEFFGEVPELTNLVNKYNYRLSLIDSNEDKEIIKDVMVKAIVDFNTNNTQLTKNSISNLKENLINLSSNRSTIGDLALIRISKKLEDIISKREDIEEWLSEKHLKDQTTEG